MSDNDDDDDDVDFFIRKPVRRAASRSSSSSGSGSYTGSEGSCDDDDDNDDEGHRSGSDRSTGSRQRYGKQGDARANGEKHDPYTLDASPRKDAKGKGRSCDPLKRQRSLSFTPPPEPNEMQLQAARQLVKKHLEAYNQGSSSFSSDEEQDGRTGGKARGADAEPSSQEALLALDPELARYYRGENAEKIRERARRQEAERQELRRRQLSLRRSESVGVSEAPSAKGKGRQEAQAGIQEEDDDSDGFQIVDTRASPSKQHTKGKVEPLRDESEIITLSDSDDGRPTIGGAPRPGAGGFHHDAPPSSTGMGSASSGAAGTAEVAEDDDTDTLQLHLRSKLANAAVDVTVRGTTKMRRIIDHFVDLHKSSLKPAEVKKVKVVFEGEALDPEKTVEECELEDDDMLDVVW